MLTSYYMKDDNENLGTFIFGDDLGMIQKKSFQELSLLDSKDFDDLDDEYIDYSAYGMVPT